MLFVNKKQISIKNYIPFSFVVALTHDREIANLTKRTQDDGSQGQQGLFGNFHILLHFTVRHHKFCDVRHVHVLITIPVTYTFDLFFRPGDASS